MDLEQAKAVIAADEEEKRVARVAERKKFLGRYFKYRNCYSCPGPNDFWWLYGKPTEIDEYGTIRGLTFQRDKDGKIEVEFSERILSISGASPADSGWHEITAAEFWREGRKIAALVNKKLVGTARRKPR